MYLLNTFPLTRLNNAEVTAFFINVQKAIIEIESEALGLATSLVTNFNNTLKKLIDQVYMAQGSELTAQMNAADTRRTQVMKRIRLRLQMVDCCDDNAALMACREVVQQHLLSKYTSEVAKMPLQQKSAVIQGFINDLTTKLNEDDLEALGIENDVSALTLANNAFITAYNERAQERASAEGQVTQKLRLQMGEYYTIVGLSVQLMANDDTPANADKAKACQDFIGVVNVYGADAKRRYLQRLGKDVPADLDTPSADDNGNQPSGDKPSGGDSVNQPSGDKPSGGNDQPSGNDPHNGATDIPDDVVFPGM